jgi:hypothetical protein
MDNISDDDQIEITLLIDCNEEGLTKEVEQAFGADNVSQASNFIGGISIAVFLVATVRALQPTIKNILDFLAQRNRRYEEAHISYDGKKLDLKGYSPDEVEKILKNPVFEKLHK